MTNIGVLGAGQLGRMLALAGIPLGNSFTFYDASSDAPAKDVGVLLAGAFDNSKLLEQFISRINLATFEFENVSVDSARKVAEKVALYPSVEALLVSQNRVSEKNFFQSLGIETAQFAPISAGERYVQERALQAALRSLGFPAILKTARLGYDGRGQAFIQSENDLDRALDAAAGQECIVERFIKFDREVSIITTRSIAGSTVFYPLVENVHRGGILRTSRCLGTDVERKQQDTAQEYARAIVERLGYVGTMTLELFDCGGKLIANEMAPRVHNSGHWSIEGAETSQFENHIRAILNLPLGDTKARGKSVMINLIGFLPDSHTVLSITGVHLHSYGKQVRPGRKVGHITVVAETDHELSARRSALEQVLRKQGYDPVS